MANPCNSRCVWNPGFVCTDKVDLFVVYLHMLLICRVNYCSLLVGTHTHTNKHKPQTPNPNPNPNPTQPHTHTTVLTRRLRQGEEVFSTSENNDIGPQLCLQPRMASRDSEQAASQPLPDASRDDHNPRLSRPTYLAPHVPRESAGER
jgi:hypothetical protein